MKNLLNDFIKNEDGVTAIEYATIGVAMSIVLFAAFGKKDEGIRKALEGAFKAISGNIVSA